MTVDNGLAFLTTSAKFEDSLRTAIHTAKDCKVGTLQTVRIIAFQLMKNMENRGYIFHNLKRIEQLTKISKLISKECKLKPEEIEDIFISAVLREIGYAKSYIENSSSDYIDAAAVADEYASKILGILTLKAERIDIILTHISNSFGTKSYIGQLKGPNILRYAQVAHAFGPKFWDIESFIRKEQSNLGIGLLPINKWYQAKFRELEELKRFIKFLRNGYYLNARRLNANEDEISHNILKGKERQRKLSMVKK